MNVYLRRMVLFQLHSLFLYVQNPMSEFFKESPICILGHFPIII